MTHLYTLYLGDSDMTLLQGLMEEKIKEIKARNPEQHSREAHHLGKIEDLLALFQNGDTTIASSNTMMGG
ncbi:hypothetical protein DFQ04_1502 [Algoriphagus boseongensis]|uniref:Uncharacterized protein n=1 Tax=Algoriphagus boseongensis TaxID=1442587 RepID=A0A4R6T8S1_9BACT|nr:hypothetical protein [Algoriphagus boseongensis]TDQ19678.1 hypothetical protein DFQ04_1502 [Algoriphagus boseongensis]